MTLRLVVPGVDFPEVGWADSLARWSAYLTVIGLSAVTIRKYRRTLINFIADTLLPLSEVTEDDVTAYLAQMDPHGSMRGETLRALRSFYGWAEGGGAEVSPVRRLKPKNPKYPDAPELAEDELVRLMVALAWREPRRAWTALLLYSTGARIASACALRADDVFGGRIHFTRRVKGEKPYSIPNVGKAAVAVAELERFRLKSLIGVSPTRVRQWLDEAGHETGIHVWPHLFRHSFASRVARETDPRTWMELLNHSDLSQYRRYVHVTEERMTSAMETL